MPRGVSAGPHCKAKAKGSQQQCRRNALPGMTVCRMHGGAAPQVRRAALRRLAEAEAVEIANAYGIPRHIDPAIGLIEEYWRSAGIVSGLETRVMAIPPEDLVWGVTETADYPSSSDGEDAERANGSGGHVTKSKAVPNIWLKLFNEERDRFAKLGLEIVRLGLEARRDEYIRSQVEAFASVLLHADLALTEQQRATAARLLRALEAVEGTVVP